MDTLLSTICSPADLKRLSDADMVKLAAEMREALCRLAATRTAHFASNMGVVELTLALHTTFDFSRDRLVWDIGHQVYPHKMVTGRYDRFQTMRAKGGLMGYPNPAESDYDLFMTGHAGMSVGTALGLKCGDDLLRPTENRRVVAVIGDGAFPSGPVFEAMNNAGGLKKNLIVILNDNKMSICPRVGGLAETLDRLRMAQFYTGLKLEVQKLLNRVPVLGDPVERFVTQVKDALKAGLLGGMFFEDIGFRYVGPVDGHNIRQLQKYLAMVRQVEGPVLLHVVTEKGHGFAPAVKDPTTFHAPAPFRRENGSIVIARRTSGRPPYTQVVRDAVLAEMQNNPKVLAITAAMCQGNMLEPIREQFPDRFFDVGICESHAVGFAAGLAKAGLRPVVDIYSTFLQRSYDQLFQEVSLQNLPVTLLLDRAGIVGPDGPTHHGVFDLTYLRPLPNFVVMAPGDASDVAPMLHWALQHGGPVAIRYAKTAAETVDRPAAGQNGEVKLGKAEVLHEGADGTLIACGALLPACVAAATRLAQQGLDFGVINARFVKPLDTETILRAVKQSPLVVTVEEGVLMGGFGSAVLEAAADAGLDASHLHRLGVPDRYLEHGPRNELLADLGLDAAGIANQCLQWLGRHVEPAASERNSVSSVTVKA
ncbi:MAG: 1-deoxy-D-xylulose-5-phosphate synthase [Planctomycetaceae bacterium]|nr:1-deoxy-D-xylulose-5-phosphate synthase [Planctomycetaceae bacterium]